MNPHMSAAMTPGTAYGTKMLIREVRPNLVERLSRSSAKTSARIIVTGTAMRA